MYKITGNTDQLTALNSAVKLLENNNNSQYSEYDYNADRSLIAIPITGYLFKPELKILCPFLINTWFDDIKEKPPSWTWLYDTPGRVIIPTFLILQEPNLRALINYCEENQILYQICELQTFVYLNILYKKDYDLLKSYSQIIFEGNIIVI